MESGKVAEMAESQKGIPIGNPYRKGWLAGQAGFRFISLEKGGGGGGGGARARYSPTPWIDVAARHKIRWNGHQEALKAPFRAPRSPPTGH